MARFDRVTIYNEFLAGGLTPLFYHQDVEVAKKIADAIADGGARILEFTNRGDKALDVFKALNSYCNERHSELILGVGSVLDAPTAAIYIAAGANFIVAPIFDAETARLCNKRKIPYMPGCGSVTEISRAEEAGVEIVKIFPGSQVGGPGFIKAVRGPMPWTRLMPTGGVDATKESIESWIKAGACAVGMGSKLVAQGLLENGDYDEIRDRVRKCLEWIREARGI
jgi:2-dehydro-3-deoxyphosphogluconate aldolase / (4S)-4-hydroxy-2-oxoglutarate aldolase